MVRLILVRSANPKAIDAAFNTLINLRRGFGKGDTLDAEEGRTYHIQPSRVKFVYKQRRGYRDWCKFMDTAAETYDDYQLEKLQQTQTEKLDR